MLLGLPAVSTAKGELVKVQYLGDVNDYRKYALLRLLAGAGLKIGVNWLLTPDDGGPDGNKRGYLARPGEFGSYDPDLFDFMERIPDQPTFSDFQQVERAGIIPGAAYFDRFVPVGTEARAAFHAASMEQFASSDLVFFDPDNGIAVRSTSKNRVNGIKFVFDDELEDHYQAGRSLLIYQHFPRIERLKFIESVGTRLRRLAPDSQMWVCHTSHVLFAIVAHSTGSGDHARKISDGLAVGRGRWPETFIRLVPLTSVNDIT